MKKLFLFRIMFLMSHYGSATAQTKTLYDFKTTTIDGKAF